MSQAASAPSSLDDENRRLRKALHGLGMLEEIAAAATSDLPSDDVINLIIEKSVEGLDAEQGALHLFDEDVAKPRFTTLARHGKPISGAVTAAAAATILGWALKHGKTLRVNDIAQRPALPPHRGRRALRTRRAAGLAGPASSVCSRCSTSSLPAASPDEDEQALHIIAAQSIHVLRATRKIGELKQTAEQLTQENSDLRKQVRHAFAAPTIIGASKPIRELLEMVEQISGVNVDVLITGESGTGKELLARTIHDNSLRAAGPFVGLNCAALPDSLLEAELFGVDKGVATGVDRRPGHFENANGGTLFLDEIGDLSLSAQAKILRALQERRVRRLGGREEIPVDVRIVAATHAKLEERIRAQRFREDLFYRLNVIRLKTPPLRKIPADIELLARHCLVESCKQIGREPIDISDDTLAVLRRYEWPGNVRELRNEMKRLAICVRGQQAQPEDLSDEVREFATEPAAEEEGFNEQLAGYERGLIEQALAAHHNNQAATAKALGLSRSGLLKKMKRLQVQ